MQDCWWTGILLRLFPELHRFGILVTRCVPQWEERHRWRWGSVNPAAHCNLCAKNECVSSHRPLACSEQHFWGQRAHHICCSVYLAHCHIIIHLSPYSFCHCSSCFSFVDITAIFSTRLGFTPCKFKQDTELIGWWMNITWCVCSCGITQVLCLCHCCSPSVQLSTMGTTRRNFNLLL